MASATGAESKLNVNIESYRKLVQTYINLHIYQSALFWADKVVALSNNNPRDIYWLAQCMYLMKQYNRAAHLLRSKELDKTYILCNYLTVKCLFEANELSEALKVLNSMDMEVFLQVTATQASLGAEFGCFDNTPQNQVRSSVLLLKGKILEAMDNRGLASDCYRQALQSDVYCFEAFESLIQHQMLTATEEQDLLNSLPISQQCTTDEAEVLTVLYKSKLKKYQEPSTKLSTEHKKPPNFNPAVSSFFSTPQPGSISSAASTPQTTSTPDVSNKPETANNDGKDSKNEEMQVEISPAILRLQKSLDMLVADAEQLYYNCDYQQCSILTERILKEDPYHSACLPIHISCQVELKQSNKLFTLGHKLVDLYPNLAISWYAVGCYYYVIEKSDCARRYLAKATSLDRFFGPAWLAYGHSFAIENEHDQAMAAYFKASQLMRGCHLPLLYIGLECGLTNNIPLATKFFEQSINIAPTDPFVLQEMGVVAFLTLKYDVAEAHFRAALKIVKQSGYQNVLPESWASLLNNLGHSLRKQHKYEEALECHQEALVLSPQTPSTFAAIAFVNALMENLTEAASWFHRALGLKRDDTFSTTMLNYVLEHLSEDDTPYPGAPDQVPDFVRKPKQISDASQKPIEESSTQNDGTDMSMSIES